MPSPRAAVFAAGAITIPTTTETAIGVVGPVNVNTSAVSQGVLVEGTFNFTAGTAATSVTIRIRSLPAGTAAPANGAAYSGGSVLATHTFTVTAASQYSFSANYLDASVAGAGTVPVAYVVTVQQTAATGNGSVNNSTVAAEECVGVW